MALDHIVKHTCRFNIKNEQHRRVNEFLSKLDPAVCKSKSQFMITATAYYIDHFGTDAFVAKPKEKGGYVTKEELEELQQKMIDAAVVAAKDEIIRLSIHGKGEAVASTYMPIQQTEEQVEEKDDDTISDYALSIMMDGMEE